MNYSCIHSLCHSAHKGSTNGRRVTRFVSLKPYTQNQWTTINFHLVSNRSMRAAKSMMRRSSLRCSSSPYTSRCMMQRRQAREEQSQALLKSKTLRMYAVEFAYVSITQLIIHWLRRVVVTALWNMCITNAWRNGSCGSVSCVNTRSWRRFTGRLWSVNCARLGILTRSTP